MAYFNNANDTTSYPTYPTHGEFDVYPTLGQTSTTEEGGVGTPTFAHGWGMSRQPDHTVGSLRSLRPEASFGEHDYSLLDDLCLTQGLETVTPVTSYTPPVHTHEQLSFPENYWPTAGPYAQSYHSGIVSRYNSFTSAVASDITTAQPTPSSVPLNYWGDSESGPSTSTSYAQTSRRPSTSLTRTGQMSGWRFQPYGASRARPEHRNAEAGPSNLVPIPFVAPLVANPSGGISEATADAESNQTLTEENGAPTTRRPRGTGPTRKWRDRYQQNVHRLRAWAKNWKNLKSLPTHESALGVALEVVETIRMPEYDKPRLSKGTGRRTAKGKTAPDEEHRRRTGIRELNEELSRYYLLETNRAAWGCPELLTKVLNDIEIAPKLSAQSCG